MAKNTKHKQQIKHMKNIKKNAKNQMNIMVQETFITGSGQYKRTAGLTAFVV